jgi:acyl dehydratase
VVAAQLSPPKRAPLAPPAASPPRPPPAPKPQPTLARSYFFSDLRVGDDLPPLAKPPVDRVQIARYSVEAHDYNRLHLDEPYAASLGYRTVFAPGALAMGFVAQLVSQWLRRGMVRKLQARFVKIVRPGDELTCRGRIAELRREKTACVAELELWAENQKGELVLRGHATCVLLESPASLPGGLFSGAPRPGLQPGRGTAPLPKKK